MAVSVRKATLVVVALVGLVGALFVPVAAEDGIGSAEINENGADTLGAGARLAVGSEFSCVVGDDTSVWCWGLNHRKQLGAFAGISSANPVQVGTGFVSISAGTFHACGVTTTGGVKCWGSNFADATGSAGPTVAVPKAVPGIANAVSVAAGYNFACATLEDGTVNCWGTNVYGQLGRGTETPSEAPGLVTGISTATTVTAGNDYACAVLANGNVMCWGRNRRGQLGRGDGQYDLSPSQSSPGLVETPSDVSVTGAVGVSGGVFHTCATLSTGDVLCWGDNLSGQLNAVYTSPFKFDDAGKVNNVFTSGANAVGFAAGDFHSCALLDGTVKVELKP